MIAVPNSPKISVDEYFEWEAKQEVRYEYINGEVFAMGGETINHSEIVAIYEDIEFLK